MKKFLLVMCLAALALFVTACRSDDDAPPAAVPTPTPEAQAQATPEPSPPPELPPADERWTPHELGPTTIRMSWWGGEARHIAVNQALDLFMERYPHIRVEPEYGAFSGHLDALVVQMAAQSEPDVLQANYAWIHNLGGGVNVFANLNDFAHIIDLSQWTDALRGFTTTADGQLAGVPHGITGRVIIYCQEMLESYGFSSFPATFDEWIELGEQVAQGNENIDTGSNTYAFFPIGRESLDIVMLTMLYNHTGRNMQADGSILYTVDEVEYMFNIWQRMIDTGTLPTFDQQEGANDVFTPVWMEGRGGSVFEWVGNIFLAGGAFLDNDPSERRVEGVGVALLPAVAPGGSRNSMQRPSLVHTISRNSDHPELAAYLLNFLYTDDEALNILGNQFGIPLSTRAAELFEEAGGAWGLQLDGFELLEANQGTMCPLFEDPNLRDARVAAIEAFRTGSIDTREAARRWVEDQQEALDDMR